MKSLPPNILKVAPDLLLGLLKLVHMGIKVRVEVNVNYPALLDKILEGKNRFCRSLILRHRVLVSFSNFICVSSDYWAFFSLLFLLFAFELLNLLWKRIKNEKVDVDSKPEENYKHVRVNMFILVHRVPNRKWITVYIYVNTVIYPIHQLWLQYSLWHLKIYRRLSI